MCSRTQELFIGAIDRPCLRHKCLISLQTGVLVQSPRIKPFTQKNHCFQVISCAGVVVDIIIVDQVALRKNQMLPLGFAHMPLAELFSSKPTCVMN